MHIIDEVKNRLDMLEIAGGYLQLQRNGVNWKARCPFHDDRDPSLVIFPGSQRWKCFGSGCNQGGDLIDLVQKMEKWDLSTTLKHLAQKAGLELSPLSEEQQRLARVRWEKEAVFSAAAAYFQDQLLSNAEQGGEGSPKTPVTSLRYALGRGWSRETLIEEGAGGMGDDRAGLRRFLIAAGVDVELPAAVALLGRRGQVRAWAAKQGLEADPKWLADDRIPAMPGHMLIYPHMVKGRVVYLAGRKIGEKGHWNPPRQLAGPRQPYFNSHWWKEDPGPALIVEGQGDALTLAQWELAGVALAGCSISSQQQEPGGLLEAIARKATLSKIYLALDADKSGLAARPEAARTLLEAGIPADKIGMVTWPAADANEWLIAGAGRAEMLKLLNASPSWLDELVKMAAKAPKDETKLMAVFKALILLPQERIILFRDQVCADLGLRKGNFDELLKITRKQENEAGHQEMQGGADGRPFQVLNSCVFQRSVNSQGCEVLDKLSNFTARIEQEMGRDNGQEVELEFRIAGEIGGKPMPVASVLAEDFDRMSWVITHWGAGAIIESGFKRRDQLRTAIQYLSGDFDKRKVFTHTGWRTLGDAGRVYLSGSGALGQEGIEVELDGDLNQYQLPVIAEDPLKAMRASLQFIHLAPFEISAPVWASIWLAPLCEIIKTNFVIWLYGRTGTLKSTLAALALNHYGAGFDGTHFPANFTDTPNRLEHKAFLVKDALLVIDDYAPQKTVREALEYQRAAHHIVRAVGNQAGRGRLTRDIKARMSYAPRGLVMVTGEDVPETESLLARLFIVEFNNDSIDRRLLTVMQQRREIYSQAMAGYLAWVAERWGDLQFTLTGLWQRYRLQATSQGIHLRLPETVASLMIGWDMGLTYALAVDALEPQEFKQLKEQGWQALLETCKAMMGRQLEEKPEEMFVNTLKELLAQGKVYLQEKDNAGYNLGGAEERAEMLGWFDESQLYLLPEAAYGKIARHYREQGSLFPVRQQTLRKGLKEAGWLLDQSGRSTRVERLGGKKQRVMVLRREVLEGIDVSAER
jgi:DNA primase